MNQEIEMVHQAFHWVEFLEGMGTFVATVIPAIFMVKNFLDKRHKARLDKEKAEWVKEKEAEILARNPPVLMTDFMKFSQENEEAHGRVGKMVGEMVLEFGDTRKVVGDLRVEVGVLKGGVNALLQMGGGPSIDDIAKKNDSKIA